MLIVFACPTFLIGEIFAFKLPTASRKPGITGICRFPFTVYFTVGIAGRRTPGLQWQQQTLRSNEEDAYNNNEDTVPREIAGPLQFLFESLVQQATGDESYHFGDLSKKTLSSLTGKNVTREGYQFGDISKHVATQAGQRLTHNEGYQFGDLTEAGLKQLEQSLADWKFKNLSDLPNSIFQRTFEGMSPEQRREVIIAFVRLAAIGVLAWGVMANLCAIGVLSIAWMKTILQFGGQLAPTTSAVGAIPISLPLLPVGPKVNSVVWNAVLTKYTSLRLFMDPFLLVVKAVGTIYLFLPYIQFIDKTEKRIPLEWRKRAPLITRAAALALAFAVNNLVLSGILGGIACVGLGGFVGKLLLAH